MAAETEPTDGQTDEDGLESAPPTANESKGSSKKRRTAGVQSSPGRPLRTPPIQIDRRVGRRDYEFIGALQHVPDKTEMSSRFGAGIYRLTCKSDGHQIWTIGELEVPAASAEPPPEPEISYPPPPEPAPPAQGGATDVQILLRIAALEQLVRYQVDARRAADDANRQGFARLEAAIDSLGTFVAELGEVEEAAPEGPKSLIEQLQEMAAMKAAMADLEGLFGQGPDTSSPWALVASEAAAGLRDIRQTMSPGQSGQAPRGAFPNPPQGPPSQQPQQAPQWPPPGQGPPPIPGMTPEKEDAIRRGIAENGFTWDQAQLYAAAHNLDADSMLKILSGDMAPPG